MKQFLAIAHHNVLCSEHFYLLASEPSLPLTVMLCAHVLLHRRELSG